MKKHIEMWLVGMYVIFKIIIGILTGIFIVFVIGGIVAAISSSPQAMSFIFVIIIASFLVLIPYEIGKKIKKEAKHADSKH